MSVPVSLLELPEVMTRFGRSPYLLTVSPESTPRATSVTVQWEGNQLIAGIGRRSVANLQANDQVALLFPPPAPGDYSLIVDGWGSVRPGAGTAMNIVIQPKSAILHVTQHN